jgi:glycosyltransferase involved in cell wall biosynthesis
VRTAVVHDWLNGMRGGEKVLEAILEVVADPTIFTLFHVPGAVSPAIERFPIVVSSLNRLPFARTQYRQYLPLFPRAVEAFDLSGFDLVVSSSHCVAKGAIAPPGVAHLCYCHTPVRYAWDQFDAYFPPGRTRLRAVKKRLVERLRRWDRATADRPTAYLANSSAVADRIRRHYGRGAAVCHPPVDVEFFCGSGDPRGDFLLAVGALVPYKRFELAIDAARAAGRPLVIVGKGPELSRLKAHAADAGAAASVEFLVDVRPEELRNLYRRCALFLQPGEEDFGIAAVEAIACGAPVAALARGGILDIVREGVDGALATEEGSEPLASAVRRVLAGSFDYTRMRERALEFRRERFVEELRRHLDAVRAMKTTSDEAMRTE